MLTDEKDNSQMESIHDNDQISPQENTDLTLCYEKLNKNSKLVKDILNVRK